MTQIIRIAGYRFKAGKLVRDQRHLSISDRLRLAAASGRKKSRGSTPLKVSYKTGALSSPIGR